MKDESDTYEKIVLISYVIKSDRGIIDSGFSNHIIFIKVSLKN